MAIAYQDVDQNLRRVVITGRLDIQGSDEISIKFAALTSILERRVVVDLTAVSFLASIGIRLIVSGAKALQRRGGRMVLLVGSDSSVQKTLDSTGIYALIPIFSDSADADKAALA